jgi:hypothetical protein
MEDGVNALLAFNTVADQARLIEHGCEIKLIDWPHAPEGMVPFGLLHEGDMFLLPKNNASAGVQNAIFYKMGSGYWWVEPHTLKPYIYAERGAPINYWQLVYPIYYLVRPGKALT